MGKILKIMFFLISVFLLVYVILPSPEFPAELPDSVQSTEPGDLETPLRRGYYTNLSREEVINYYNFEFNKPRKLYTVRLNYPPEEAKTIIRDQTKSTFLEELVHPLRESLYINGFESEGTIYEFKINEVIWKNKIIVKYVASNVYMRLVIVFLIIISAYLLAKEYLNVKEN